MEYKNFVKGKRQDIENELGHYEEKQAPLLTKEDFMNFGKNTRNYIKFFWETLSEKPEAESYPLYFLPAMVVLFFFYIFSFVASYSILKSAIHSFLVATISLSFLMAGLKISIFAFRSSGSFQEIFITLSFFCLPLVVGLFFAWLLSYGTWVAGYLVLYASHLVSVVSIYCVLPKTLLMQGLSRFLCILITLGCPVLGIAFLLRIIKC